MKRLFFMALGLSLGAVLVAGCSGATEQYSPASFPTIARANDAGQSAGIVLSQQDTGLWVTGEGKVTAAPDIAMLSLGVETQMETVAEAQSEAAAAMDNIIKVLKGKGIADKDIQTQQYNIYPVRRSIPLSDRGSREELVGYRVTNTVTAKIRKVEQTGSVIDDVVEAGGDATRINSISFTIDDPTEIYREARDKAVKDAMMKADQIADVAGIELGKPIYISEGTIYNPPLARNAFDVVAAAAPVPETAISAGELEYTVNVSMVYGIR